jgi:hypothetical protein
MIRPDDTIYFSNVSFNFYHDNFWNTMYPECDDGGKFYINMARRVNPCRFISRNGEWSLPWKQDLIPGYEMPVYNPTFNKTFEEISDEQALLIKQRINQGERFAVMFSGGIDSTVVMSALIKNLTVEELKSVVVCASVETIIENPHFWNSYVQDKFDIIDSDKNKYDDIISQGYTPITADEGDCIFGTLFGLVLYNNYDAWAGTLSNESRVELSNIKYKISDPEIHYSRYKDLLISYLSVQADPDFGKLLYEKLVRNIDTATVPVNSLHDFFWWMIFNIKYLNCAVRGSIYINDTMEVETVMRKIVNWFSYPDYQRWSMVNNNNGLKIKSTPASYKTAAKDYIWEFDRNDWYKNFKVKLESLWVIGHRQDVSNIPKSLRPVSRIGLTKNYEVMYIDDPSVQNFYKENLTKFKIDWR